MSVFPRGVFLFLFLHGYFKLCCGWASRIYKVTAHTALSLDVKTCFVLEK